MTSLLLLLAALSAAAVWFLLFPLRGQLVRLEMIDVPNRRSSHHSPTPRGGGIVIVAVTALLWIPVALGVVRLAAGTVAATGIGLLLIAAISWRDDRRPLSNRVRIASHLAAAALLVAAAGPFRSISVPLFPEIALGAAAVPLTLLWIVAVINIYNFMDGIDGLAGGQAFVAGAGWAAVGAMTESPAVSALGAIVAGGALGFLRHNWHPARLFMGDVGSASLGFIFAGLPLLTSEPGSRSLFVAVMLLLPFIFDGTVTLFRRLLNGENIFKAHRTHLYQRLVRAGWSHATVAVLYLGAAAMGSFGAILWIHVGQGEGGIVLLLASLVLLSLWTLVSVVESRTIF